MSIDKYYKVILKHKPALRLLWERDIKGLCCFLLHIKDLTSLIHHNKPSDLVISFVTTYK